MGRNKLDVAEKKKPIALALRPRTLELLDGFLAKHNAVPYHQRLNRSTAVELLLHERFGRDAEDNIPPEMGEVIRPSPTAYHTTYTPDTADIEFDVLMASEIIK